MAAAMASREMSMAPSTERSASNDWGGTRPGLSAKSSACMGLTRARASSMVSLLCGQPLQGVAHELQILPRLPLERRRPEQRRGMIRRDDRDAAIVERLS